MRSPEVTEVEIPADILAAIEGERQDTHPNAYVWEEWQDAVIQKYWDRYSETGVTQASVRRILGSRGKRAPSENTVRKRVKELQDG